MFKFIKRIIKQFKERKFKFKIGDKVKVVRRGIPTVWDSRSFIDYHLGKEYVVTGLHIDNRRYYSLNCFYGFREEELELVK